MQNAMTDGVLPRRPNVARLRFPPTLEPLRRSPGTTWPQLEQLLRFPTPPALTRLERSGTGHAGKEKDGGATRARAAKSAYRATVPKK